jgi:hypothetical protein
MQLMRVLFKSAKKEHCASMHLVEKILHALWSKLQHHACTVHACALCAAVAWRGPWSEGKLHQRGVPLPIHKWVHMHHRPTETKFKANVEARFCG